MFHFGSSELLILFLIILIIFGASRLPQLGGALGKGIQNFRKSLKGEDPEATPKTEAKSEESTNQDKPA